MYILTLTYHITYTIQISSLLLVLVRLNVLFLRQNKVGATKYGISAIISNIRLQYLIIRQFSC